MRYGPMSRYAHEYKRHERDFYPTPYEVVLPLLPHLQDNTEFIEPCAGDGILIEHLRKHGHIKMYACDIEPQAAGIDQLDALDIEWSDGTIITNPPWDRKILHPMIEAFRQVDGGCWLVFDANWMHTKQSIPYMPHCSKIITVGRVRWIGEKPGKDDVCWYHFGKDILTTEFYGRG